MRHPTTARLKYYRGIQRKVMQSTLTYRFEEDEHPTLEAIRLTVRTVNMAGVGLQQRLLREAIEQWRVETNNPTDEQRAAQQKEANRGKEKETGQDAQEEVLTPEKEITGEERTLHNQYSRWPVLAVATADKVLIVKRGKKSKELDDESPDNWPWETSSKAALGWDKPNGILNIPWDFFAEWEKHAHAVNNGLFSPAIDNSAWKKKGMGLISTI